MWLGVHSYVKHRGDLRLVFDIYYCFVTLWHQAIHQLQARKR